MWKRFNFKWDKRTLFNVLNFPIILFIRVPLVLLFWAMEWLTGKLSNVADNLPGWKS